MSYGLATNIHINDEINFKDSNNKEVSIKIIDIYYSNINKKTYITYKINNKQFTKDTDDFYNTINLHKKAE